MYFCRERALTVDTRTTVLNSFALEVAGQGLCGTRKYDMQLTQVARILGPDCFRNLTKPQSVVWSPVAPKLPLSLGCPEFSQKVNAFKLGQQSTTKAEALKACSVACRSHSVFDWLTSNERGNKLSMRGSACMISDVIQEVSYHPYATQSREKLHQRNY